MERVGGTELPQCICDVRLVRNSKYTSERPIPKDHQGSLLKNGRSCIANHDVPLECLGHYHIVCHCCLEL